MKKSSVKLLIFLFTVIIMGVLGGIYSLIFAGLASETALSLAPQFSIGLMERYICPEGAHLQFENEQSAVSNQAVNSYLVNCITRDGTVIQGLKPKAMSSVFGMFFLLFFIPSYIPGAILLWIFLNRQFPRFFDESPVPMDDQEVFAK